MRTPCIAVLALLLLELSASAAETRHAVLRVDHDDIYVDLGTADGVDAGSELRLLDVVTATHPVTGKKVRDTFEVGRMTVAVAGKRVSIARSADDRLKKRVSVGDEVELASAPVTVRDPWDDATSPRPAGGPGEQAIDEADAHAPDFDAASGAAASAEQRKAAQHRLDQDKAVRDAWQATLGEPPEQRIAIWSAYLKKYPDSPYKKAVEGEIISLSRQIDASEARAAEERDARAAEPGSPLDALPADADILLSGPVAFSPPTRVYEGASFELSLLAIQPGTVGAAWVHFRRAGEPTYQRLAMDIEPGGALRARIPAAEVHPPRVEYFVEVLATGAKSPEAVIGSAEAPASVTVDASVEEPARDLKNRSRISISMDYVDFDGIGSDFDQYWQIDADFMYRFRGPVYALRLGFSTLAGDGGPRDAVKLGCRDPESGGPDPDCHHVAFNFAYVELEFRLSDIVAVMVRPMYGGGDVQVAANTSELTDSYGLRTRLRLGREMETNLVLGVGLVSDFGTVFEAAFTWDVIPRFPIVLSTQVTDQPVAANFGVRLIADVGWRGVSWFYPSVRLAYQVRDLDVDGLSAGLAMNFDW